MTLQLSFFYFIELTLNRIKHKDNKNHAYIKYVQCLFMFYGLFILHL